MSIEPVRHSIEVTCAPPRAFALFTVNMGKWWPGGRTPAANPAVDVVVEPEVGGRWYEVDAQGHETQWGKVVAYDAPDRLILGWQLGRDFRYEPDLLTEVEIRFTATASGGTRVTLEHRDLERFGDYALERRAQVDGGWPSRLADFATFTETEAEGALS